MTWFLFAILTALFQSLVDVRSKLAGLKFDEYVLAWSLAAFALPIMGAPLLFLPLAPIQPGFGLALFSAIGFEVVAIVLYMKAIRTSDLSAVVPMVAFTPLFMLIAAPIIAGDQLSSLGVIGVFLIIIGSYTLNLSSSKKGFMEPFRALVRDRGPRLMLAVAFLWSITSSYHKVGIRYSSPVIWGFVYFVLLSAVLFPIMLIKSKKPFKEIQSGWRHLIPIGFLAGLAVLCQNAAVSLGSVTYVISVKRTSILLSVLWGYFLFKETEIRDRLAGALLMVAGVICISLAG